MAFPKIKVCWDGSRVEADWHLGLFGIYARGIAGGRLRGVVISARGALAWMAGLAVVAYFTGAAALWFWLERRPYNYVTYADLVLPTRWSEIQKLRGKALVAEGLDDIKARKWGEGLSKLRNGIGKNPDEVAGRLTLAELFLAMKARKLAMETFEGGLAKTYPGRDYMDAVLRVTTQAEDHESALRMCARALALVSHDAALSAERVWLLDRKLGILVDSGRADEALVMTEAEEALNSTRVGEHRVMALLKLGRASDAVGFLEKWSARVGGRDPQVLRLQARAYREAGDIASMEKALEAVRALSPTDPRPYVYGIVQQLLAGRRAEANAGLERFLLRFGSMPQAVQMLAAPLSEIAERPLLERLIAHARQQGFDLGPFNRFLMVTLVANAEWTDVLRVLDANAGASTSAEETAWRELMRAQARAALDASEVMQSNLVSRVRGRQFTLGAYKDLIRNMRRAGRLETAREIVTFAQGVYPHHAELEAWRKQLDEGLAAAKVVAESSTARVQPNVAENRERPIEPGVARTEWTEAEFATRFDALKKSGDHAGALQLLREARLAKPAWIASREGQLLRDEVRLSGLTGDILTLRSSVRLWANGDPARSAQLVEIARELRAANRTGEAIFVLKGLLAKVPDFPVAKRLLAEWTPTPKE